MTASFIDRSGFVRTISEVFDAAGIEYAFLHNLHGINQSDSDVDIVASRGSLAAIDTILRCGALGPLVQRLEYDVPWCLYYVVETADPNRRFREIDVACDPFGIGVYGDALDVDLARRRWVNHLPVLAANDAIKYLAAKRAGKGVRGSDDLAQLRSAFQSDPEGAEDGLQRAFGTAGTSLASALRRDEDVSGNLLQIRAAIARRRRTPRRLAQRVRFEVPRISRRVRRPAGLTVVLAGPDGAGKSTLAAALGASALGPFRTVRFLHLRPGLLPPLGRIMRRPVAVSSASPHEDRPSGTTVSLIRICWLAADTALGWWPRIQKYKIRSSLVVLERGWRDLEVDPVRHRLSSGLGLARFLGRALPKPDLTLVLHASPASIYERKPEIPRDEIARQLGMWSEFAIQSPDSVRVIPANSVDETLEFSLTEVSRHMARRSASLRAFSTAVTCLGEPRVGGTPFTLVTARGHPRWIIPRRVGVRGPVGAKLYRSPNAAHHLMANAIEVGCRVGRGGAAVLTFDTQAGLGPEITAALGLRDIELAALLPTDENRRERAIISVLQDGKPVAIAKVAPAGSPELQNELEVLTALEVCTLRALIVPRVLASFSWNGLDVVVETVLDLRGRTNRPVAAAELGALTELASLTDRLGPAIRGTGEVISHGDFTGWNTAQLRNGGLGVWDWEWAHRGHRLFDWLHWNVQRISQFGGDPADFVRSILVPTRDVSTALSALDAVPADAPAALEQYLTSGGPMMQNPIRGRACNVRRYMLGLLTGEAVDAP